MSIPVGYTQFVLLCDMGYKKTTNNFKIEFGSGWTNEVSFYFREPKKSFFIFTKWTKTNFSFFNAGRYYVELNTEYAEAYPILESMLKDAADEANKIIARRNSKINVKKIKQNTSLKKALEDESKNSH